MRFVARLIFKIIVLLIIGAGSACIVLSYNKRFIATVNHAITTLIEKRCNAHFSGLLTHISPLTLSVTFERVSLRPFDVQEGWYCNVQKVQVTISPFTYLKTKKWGVLLLVHGCDVFSEVQQGRIRLVDYVTTLLAAQDRPLPLLLKTLRFFDTHVSLLDMTQNYGMHSVLNGEVQKGESTLKAHLFLRSGAAHYHKKEVITKVSGRVDLEVTPEGKLILFPDCFCLLSQLPPDQNRWYISGRWMQTKGSFLLHNQDKSVLLAPIALECTDEGIALQLRGTFPIKDFLHGAHVPFAAQTTGMCTLSLEGTLGKRIEGDITLTDIGIGAQRLDSLQSSFIFQGCNGRGAITYNQQGQLFVTDWIWDQKKRQVKFVGTNRTPLTLMGSGWQIPSEKIKIRGTVSSLLQGTFFYQLYAQQEKTESCLALEGKIQSKGADYIHTGTLLTNEREYDVSVTSAPFLLRLLEKKNGPVEPLLEIIGNGMEITGTLDSVLIQNFLHEYQGVELGMQGILNVTGSWQKGSGIHARLALEDGVIRKPDIYNFMHSMQADIVIDLMHKKIVVEHLKIALQKGTIESSSIKAGYDPVYKEWWVHAPFRCADCFINWKKDLYVLFSGAVVAKKMPGKIPELEGFITFDRSQLKENIFSAHAQQVLVQSFTPSSSSKTKLAVKLALSTRVPLRVKTAQLETQAMLALVCEGEISKPTISGDIFLQGGAIHFPANSLSIVKGKISFAGEQTHDPLIELVAQGRIKKYLLTVSVVGTAQDPQIVFDAVPSLSQEQCMMLLIAGSEEESLNIVAPVLIMRTIENSIFGSSYRTRTDAWLAPLKRIKFVPRFTDQTGRGGFKGALEIEVNKRLRGIIEKNFSLTEDVSFEVEYDLSDSTSIRALLDERGDLGAEIEMRFKF